MKTYLVTWSLLVVFSVGALACAPAATPAPPPGTATPKTAASQEWEKEWNDLVAAAQKEVTLTIYTALKPEAREAITSAMKEKYGITVEMVVGRGGDLPPKIRAERGAGLYLPDIGMIGPGTFTTDLKPMGITPSLEAMLVLPEIKDASKWFAGRLPFIDAEKQAIAPVLSGMPSYIRSTEKVGVNEIATSKDLLNPKWKGNIVIFDPSVTGQANNWYMSMHKNVLGMEQGKKFMQDLVKQEPIVLRDDRIITDSVARGKYLIGIGASPSTVGEFIKLSAPVDFIDVPEPREIVPGAGLLNAFSNPPHPNAQKLFVNWILSKEGVATLAKAAVFAPARTDVSGEGVLPIMFPRKGDVPTNSESELLKGKMRTEAREIFGALTK